MAAADFPDSPSVGDEFTVGTQTRVWNGVAWVFKPTITQGPIGFTGSQGVIGSLGFTGSRGFLGYTGSAGAGYSGSRGFTGSLGFTGSKGEIGYSGSAGPSEANIAVVANTGLAVSGNLLTTTYNTLISDTVNSIAVGGAAVANAAVWKAKTIVQVLDTILFPDVLPTYTIPTISISGTSGTREIGLPVTQTLSISATKNDAAAFTQLVAKRGGTTLTTNTTPTITLASNISAQFGYDNPNNQNFSYSISWVDSWSVVNGSTTWTAEGNYGAGLAKFNNKGVLDTRTPAVRSTNAPQAASSNFASSGLTITGIYPYFYGKSATLPNATYIASVIAAGGATKVLSAASGTVSINYAASSQYIWMAHLATYTEKTKWYFNALNNGSIGPGNFILAPVTSNVNSPEGYWTGVSFKMYWSDVATITTETLEFRNT